MHYPYAPSRGAFAGHTLHAMLASVPLVCFSLTLVSDVAYWQTSFLMWHNFSSWLLFAGLVFGGLSVLVGVISYIAFPLSRAQESVLPYAASMAAMLCLALINSFMHAGDGWTAIVPYGLVLSVLTFLLALITAALGRIRYYRYQIAGARNG